MRTLWFVVALCMLSWSTAHAQFVAPPSDAVPSPSPTREDVAASYTATPVPLGALGSCAAMAGTYASVSGGLRVEPHYCDGVEWVSILTEKNLNADVDIFPHAVIAQAAAGEYGFRVLHDGVYTDFGGSTNDRVYASNGTVIANSWKFGDITVETIGSAQGYIWMFSPTPFPAGSLIPCTSGRKGALQTLSSDGRTYQCNGTVDQTFAWREVWTGALDFAVFASNSCQNLTFTATGAVAGEPIAEGGCGPAMAGDPDLTCKVSISDTNTASVRICCNDTLGCANLASITFTAAALR